MEGLQIVVALGAAIFVAAVVARRTGISQPVLLLVLGVALGAIPAFRHAPLPSQIVLVLFLPALLYWESLTTSLREIRRMKRVIFMNGVLLVAVTTVAVAAVAHQFGMGWAPAFVLGAAVAPTDATAVAAVAARLPRRVQTVLRAESLINDGMALVLYGLAVTVSIGGGEPSAGEITVRLVASYGVGVLAGLATAWLAVRARQLAHKPLFENVVSVLTPFVAYLVSEELYGSGVIAVVVAGLTLSQIGPRHTTAATRLQATAFWTLSTFLLNGTLFLLVGLQVWQIVADLDGGLGSALGRALEVLGAVVAVRIVFAYIMTWLIRMVDRREVQRAMRASARQRFVSAWAGPRGAISLAAALAVPSTLRNGQPFTDRDFIVFATFVVIVGTLVVQGSTLGLVARWAQLPEDTARRDEVRLAEKQMGEAVRESLRPTAGELHLQPQVADKLSHTYDWLHTDLAAQYHQLQLAMLDVKRAQLFELRDEQQIDDIVMRQVLARLDRQEVSLRPEQTEA